MHPFSTRSAVQIHASLNLNSAAALCRLALIYERIIQTHTKSIQKEEGTKEHVQINKLISATQIACPSQDISQIVHR
jgi:hypothetical protein